MPMPKYYTAQFEGGQWYVLAPRDQATGLLPVAPAEISRAYDTKQGAKEAIASYRATAYNAYIFAPCEDMAEARRRVADAALDLSDSAAGWGTLTLDNARAQLVRAIELIDTMKGHHV